MQNIKQDAILLGFGEGFLELSEEIVTEAKQMREEIKATYGVDYPQVRIVDNDFDAAMQTVKLLENEFVIRIYGEEKVRRQVDQMQSKMMIDELKKTILANLDQFDQD